MWKSDLISDIAWFVSIISMLVGVIANVVWHFQYPDATETRLFLMFWKEYVGLVIVVLVFGGIATFFEE